MDSNQSENFAPTNELEEGEIQEIIQLEGIELCYQDQKVLEQQALTHLQTLTENSKKKNGEQIETQSLDLNKYLASQAELKQKYVQKKNNEISDKSKEVANKVCRLNFEKFDPDPKLNRNQNQKRKRKSNSESDESIKTTNTSNDNDNGLRNDSDETISLEIETKRKRICNSEPNKTSIISDNESDDNPVLENESGSEYIPSDEFNSDFDPVSERCDSKWKRKRKSEQIGEKIKDDGIITKYNARLEDYYKTCELSEDVCIEDDLKIPLHCWNKLYSYQQDGIKWLWNIHKQKVGALLGDEMGLGKTVQIIVFFAALQYSQIKISREKNIGLGPSIIVCPATVIQQWVKHFHNWWPPFQVVLLHQSGSYIGNKMQLINDVYKSNGILVTTYESVLKYKGILIEKHWHYLVLDEGHKIRNPNAKITIAVKHFHTNHKLLLTGSPLQNNLQELWSLFDFIVPGKLGTQQAFTDYFATPITQGGYLNATPTQETTALLIATSLKDMISPFMLRRTKEEVKDIIYLPNKSEQVLFCSLSEEQRDLYKGYLLSDHIGGILGRTSASTTASWYQHSRANILMAITTLRKICNHPDLYLGEDENNQNNDEEMQFGYYKRSGKMIVVAALLKIWKRQGHRVLLFTQSRTMIEIFERFLTKFEYKYVKMDGTTTIANRQSIIDLFNHDSSYDVFLMTTRVGGLGVNLTGANRVVIYDPDWNPATDTQARERAWRIGQRKQVTVYRLVSAGTIEEKMYQRQVWKQLLSNKILIDPKTKRYFKTSDLNELFSLQEQTDTNPETANIFQNSKVEVSARKKKQKKKLTFQSSDTSLKFSEDKIQQMKNLAQQIAQNLSQKKLKEEEKQRKAEAQQVPRPSPVELLAINRKKLEVKEEPVVNKVDDNETVVSFSDALIVAERNCKNYHKKTKDKTADDEVMKEMPKEKESVIVDKRGQIDGEQVEGLLRREVKKCKEKKKLKQDDYVLEKLFSKKGVHTALEHDVIVQSGSTKGQNLRVHYEAKQKADMALKALRKSRLQNWSW